MTGVAAGAALVGAGAVYRSALEEEYELPDSKLSLLFDVEMATNLVGGF